MFWTIAGALIFVFFVVPIVLQLIFALIGAISDGSTTLGCIGLTVVLIVLLIIIF